MDMKGQKLRQIVSKTPASLPGHSSSSSVEAKKKKSSLFDLPSKHALQGGYVVAVKKSNDKKDKKKGKLENNQGDSSSNSRSGSKSSDEGNDDIGDLFASLKKGKQERKEAEALEAKRLEKERRQSEKAAKVTGLASDYQSSFYSSSKTSADKKSKVSMSVDGQLEAPLERIDPESGFPVYKAHLLGVGGGGGTDLCPFDCTCCF